jgi:hypothetical protein
LAGWLNKLGFMEPGLFHEAVAGAFTAKIPEVKVPLVPYFCALDVQADAFQVVGVPSFFAGHVFILG